LNNKDVPKIILANTDDAHAKDFLAFPCDHAYGFGFVQADREGFYVHDLHVESNALSFVLDGQLIEVPLLGAFNAKNVLAAASVCRALGYSVQEIAQAAETLHSIPGRMERIDEGQPFLVYVDYAYEPVALQAVYETLGLLSYQRLIQVIGSAGGGRDKSRRRILGRWLHKRRMR
jgi:UDP-N-acetylmuramoyl-L-alanyl-D-glutamate--2,6-diaminopimelate ligase